MSQTNAYTGLSLPAVQRGGGYFVNQQPLNRVWGDILLTVYTPIGSRPMRRSFGSALWNMILGQSKNAVGIQAAISVPVSQWVPYVTLGTISGTIQLNGNVGLQVNYGIVGDVNLSGSNPTAPNSGAAFL